jgi:hypothetical protein
MPSFASGLVCDAWGKVRFGLFNIAPESYAAGGRNLLKVIATVGVTTGLTFSLTSGATTTSAVSAIIQRSVEANSRDWSLQTDFSHVERIVKNKIDSDEAIQSSGSKTYEILMIDGSPYNQLIAINNEPLSHVQEQTERAKLDREIAARRNESASDRRARIDKFRQERSDEHLLMQQMAAAFNFERIGDERIQGVECFRFKATPKPDYIPPVQKARVLKGMHGQMWIDKQQYHWVKVQAEVTEPVSFGFFIAKVNPGTRFELQQAQFGQYWLPKYFIQTVRASVLGLYGFRSQEETFYSNYRQLKARTKEKASIQ